MPKPSKSTALAVLFFLAFAVWQVAIAARGHEIFGDFRAFYCAGSAVLHHADPYAAASLTACEHAPVPRGFYTPPAGVTIPAPFPAYALWLFAVFALLPYAAACAAWLLLIVISIAASVRGISKLTQHSPAGALAVLTIGYGAIVLPYGQLAPVEIAALTALALALRAQRWNAAAAAALCTAILPHVAAPALLCVGLACRPMRARLAIVGSALLALNLAAGGVHGTIEYFTQVLPAHAVSEIGRTSQYGTSWIAHALGASDRSALGIGNLWYAAMAIAGIAVGRKLMTRCGDPAYAALIPAACAVFGGTFVHYTEIMAALPAALLLCATLPAQKRLPALAAALLIGIPWAICVNQPLMMLLFGVAGAAFVLTFGRASYSAGVRWGMVCTAVAALLIVAAAHFGPGLSDGSQSTHVTRSFAQASWAQYVQTHWSGTGAIWWLLKAPTWTGLALLVLLAARGANAVANEDLVLPVVVKHAPVRS